ncbi:hypothetical protein MIND_00376700 [Mycena indigotica]|uniref:Glycolipid transfer protein domain-containing protein n=1 Tax=Mycena indigotica TaxID=2126181 RepID=A0A8H6W9T4_9AGAR|nr:uncharacterized protein MIND_00376700 [Mycena indigotica]KAF7310037.1 hypothetical protein MIND_00376700 [Mycena indigotica]
MPLKASVSRASLGSRRPLTLADTKFFEKDADFPKPDKESRAYDVRQFLTATEVFISIFDILGLSAFSVIKNDFQENIKIARTILEKDMSIASLQQVAGSGAPAKLNKAVLSELRNLCFLCKALDDTMPTGAQKPLEPAAAFSASYKKYLQKHHNMVDTSLYSAAIDACPSRESFIQAIGGDSEDLKSRVKALSEILTAMAAPDAFGDKLKWP